MSTKAVIIALVVALVLGIGAYLVLQPGAKPVAKADVFGKGEQVFKIEPGAVNVIEIESSSGERQIIRRAQGGSSMPGYSLTVTRQSADNAPAWPLEDGRVSSLLRKLKETPSLDAPDEKSEIDADATRVTIREDSGAVTHFLLADRLLGGKGLIKVIPGTSGDSLTLSELRARPGKLALVDDTIHNVFRNPGPRGWRETLALRSVGPEVSRIHLINEDLSMRLSRLEGRWNVIEPVGAPADATAVGRLIDTLGALQITGFLDGADAASVVPGDDLTGLDNPRAVVTAETDRRVIETDPAKPGGDVSIKTETHELLIGKPAGTDALTRYARLGKNGPVVVISARGLVRELFDPAGYVSKKVVQAPAADIGMLVLERSNLVPDLATAPGAPAPPPVEPFGRVFRRDLDRWKEVTGATETALDDNMTKAVADVLKFLTSDDATSLALGSPAVWREQGRLVVGSLGGAPIDTIVLGGSDSADLVVRTGEGKNVVYRSYQRDRVPALLLAVMPRPTEAVKAPEGVKDVVK